MYRAIGGIPGMCESLKEGLPFQSTCSCATGWESNCEGCNEWLFWCCSVQSYSIQEAIFFLMELGWLGPCISITLSVVMLEEGLGLQGDQTLFLVLV